MAYLSGQNCKLEFATSVPKWAWTAADDIGSITSIRHKQTLDHAQVKVMQQAHANTVGGAYHTTYTLGIAISDGLVADDLQVGQAGVLTFSYKVGAGATNDELGVTVEISDVEVAAEVSGAVVGTIELQGNSALTHLVNQA